MAGEVATVIVAPILMAWFRIFDVVIIPERSGASTRFTNRLRAPSWPRRRGTDHWGPWRGIWDDRGECVGDLGAMGLDRGGVFEEDLGDLQSGRPLMSKIFRPVSRV